MKTQTIKELNVNQFDLLSWYATCIFNRVQDEKRGIKIDQFRTGKLQGIASACTFAGIADLLVYDVEINHNFRRLQNHNRLTETVYFQ